WISSAPGSRATSGRSHARCENGGFLPVIPVGHLILMKLESGRSKDDADVVELLKAGASPAAVARYLRRTWPELLPRFRRLTAQARTERSPRPRRPPVRRTRR